MEAYVPTLRYIMQQLPNIAGYEFDGFIMGASGCHDHTLEELTELAKSESAAIVTKSCTLAPLSGNDGTIYWEGDDRAINSIGLKNRGCQYIFDDLRHIETDKVKMVSIAAEQKGTNAALALYALEKTRGAKLLLEFNVSCPNTNGKMLGYNFEKLEVVLHMVDSIVESPYGLKLPAYLDVSQFEQIVAIIKKHPFVQFITCINSVRGLIINLNNNNIPTAITPNEGIGGVSGPIIKPLGLANVGTFRKMFEENNVNISIIGCGGISTVNDVVEYLMCGADALQIGFQLKKEGPSVFKRLHRELRDLID